jgi:hypothetical protein
MSKDQGRGVVKLMIFGMGCFLALIVYVFAQAYQGRAALVNSQRAGCERSKLDRGANAEGWRAAEQARLMGLANQMRISYEAAQKVVKQPSTSDESPDLVAARKYDAIASGLEERSKIDCAVAFPSAKFFP